MLLPATWAASTGTAHPETGLPEAGGTECFLRQFRRNVTVVAGALLRMACPSNCPPTGWSHASPGQPPRPVTSG